MKKLLRKANLLPFVLVAFIATVATDCDYTPLYLGDSNLPKLAMFGDSLSSSDSEALYSLFQQTHYTSLDVAPGQGLEFNEQYAQRVACYEFPVETCTPADQPAVVVINLGTNDILSGIPNTLNIERLARHYGYFPGKCIIGVTISETSFNPVYNQATVAEYNAYIRANATVTADWALAITGQETTYLASDGTHHSPAGQVLMRSLYATALQSCPA